MSHPLHLVLIFACKFEYLAQDFGTGNNQIVFTLDLPLFPYSLALKQRVELAGAVESDKLPLVVQLNDYTDDIELQRTKMWNFCFNKWPSCQSTIASKLKKILTANSIGLLKKQVTY